MCAASASCSASSKSSEVFEKTQVLGRHLIEEYLIRKSHSIHEEACARTVKYSAQCRLCLLRIAAYRLKCFHTKYPQVTCAILVRAQKPALIVSHESDYRPRRGILELKDLINAAFGVGPSIDVVSQEYGAIITR